MVFLEGVRLIEEAVEAGVHFESVAFSPALESTERGRALLDSLENVPCRGAYVSKQVMSAIADTESPQGVVALVSRPHFELNDVVHEGASLIVIADQLQDPGNLGSIIRTAEAAGANGVITTRYTVDPFNHKALRASMGAALRLPLATDVHRADTVALCRQRMIKIIASRPAERRPIGLIEDASLVETSRAYTDADLTMAFALILGSEASGVSEDAAAQADEVVHIPMARSVESLNVAAAAAILLYEAARQRNFERMKDEG